MKKHTAVTLLTAILVVLGATVYGQQRNIKTETDSKWQMWYGGGPRIIKTYSFYYNDNDDKVLHGSYTEKAEYGGGNEMSYSFTATYKDGKLDGLVKLKFYELKSGLWNYVDYIYLDLSANFSNGIPCGTWKLSKDGWTNKKTAMKKPPLNAKKTEVTFVDGKIAKYVSGNEWVTFNNGEVANYELEDKGVKIKDGYALEFLRKNGDHSPLSEEQKQLIDNFESGKITKEELIRKGYVLEEKEFTFDGMAYISRSVCDGWTSHNADLSHGVSSYMGYANLKYFILKKIQTEEATLEQCLKYCNNATYDDAKIKLYNSLMENSCFYKTQGYGKDEVMCCYVLSERVKAELTDAVSDIFLPKYNEATSLMNKSKDENSLDAVCIYYDAATKYEKILYWRDSKQKYEYCKQKLAEILDAISETEYNKAKEMLNEKNTYKIYNMADLATYKQIYKFLYILDDYKDSKSLLKVCDERISDISEQLYNYADDIIKKVKDAAATKSALDSIDMAIYIFKTFYDESYGVQELHVYNMNMENKLKECQRCKNNILNEFKIIESLNDILDKEMKEIVEVTKYQKPGKVVFMYKAPTKFYDNFDYSGFNINNDQYQTYYQAKVLEEYLSKYCPMLGYRILEINKNKKGKYYIVSCEFDQIINIKNNEYETYKGTFKITYEGKIIANTIFSSIKKVLNDWDKLKDNDRKILTKSKECKNIVSAYSKYKKTAETTTNAKLKAIIANQEKILKAINSSNAVELDNKVKQLKDKSIENVIKTIQ